MKRSVLILTDTYFQLFVAVRLRQTVYKDDQVDLIITDHSSGCEAVAERMRSEHLFREVFFVHDDDSFRESFPDKVKRYVKARIAPAASLRRYVQLQDHYDVVLFSNPSMLAHLLCFCCRQAACYRMEEGYSTYTRPFLVKKPLRRVMIRAAFGDLRKRLKGIYLFHPELFHQPVEYPVLKMPPFGKQDEELKAVLNRVFDYSANRESYDADYIFLEESFQGAEREVDDLELMCRISETVGGENLMIKRHPRKKEALGEHCAFRVSRTSAVPWELILMNEDFSNKTLLTITSSSALACALYGFASAGVYLLYRCVQVPSPMMDDGYLQFVSDLRKDHPDIIVPTGIDVFLRQLQGRETGGKH